MGNQNFLDPQPALIVPSPALITPMPDYFFVNKSTSKEAPKVPKSIDIKPPFCSLTSFFTFSVIPFNNIPLSSNEISSLEIINVV